MRNRFFASFIILRLKPALSPASSIAIAGTGPSRSMSANHALARAVFVGGLITGASPTASASGVAGALSLSISA
jgi:hypothetical protein